MVPLYKQIAKIVQILKSEILRENNEAKYFNGENLHSSFYLPLSLPTNHCLSICPFLEILDYCLYQFKIWDFLMIHSKLPRLLVCYISEILICRTLDLEKLDYLIIPLLLSPSSTTPSYHFMSMSEIPHSTHTYLFSINQTKGSLRLFQHDQFNFEIQP